MSFPFVQFEFAFALGPADGRYLRRSEAAGEAERVLVLRTLGATPQKRRRLRRPRRVERADAAPVPSVRATVIRPAQFESEDAAAAWLARLRADEDARADEVVDAARELNFMLRAHRAAALDPHARDVASDVATVVRIGYGSGDLVADGRYDAAFEVPARRQKRRRAEALAPQEHLAAVLAGRERLLPATELVLRARSDVEADRPREAALQARIALEALLAEPDVDASLVAPHRQAVADAANAALEAAPAAALVGAIEAAVAAMERTLRRARSVSERAP